MTALRYEPARTAALLLAAVLLALTALWATPAPAYACSCVESTDAEHAARADAIFTGSVTDDRVDEGEQTRTITFAVDRVYKNAAVTATQVVTSHSSGAACGLEISGPGPFLVFAEQELSGLTANLCGGTRAGPAPVSLGSGEAPRPDSAPTALTGRWVPLVGLFLAATAAAVIGVSLIRQRPR